MFAGYLLEMRIVSNGDNKPINKHDETISAAIVCSLNTHARLCDAPDIAEPEKEMGGGGGGGGGGETGKERGFDSNDLPVVGSFDDPLMLWVWAFEQKISAKVKCPAYAPLPPSPPPA